MVNPHCSKIVTSECESRSNASHFSARLTIAPDASYNSLPSDGSPYGNSIRFREQAEELEQQLDFFSTILGVSGLRDTRLEDAEIFDIITTIEGVEAETIDGGMYVMNPGFLFGYLDMLYLKLLDAAASKIVKD